MRLPKLAGLGLSCLLLATAFPVHCAGQVFSQPGYTPPDGVGKAEIDLTYGRSKLIPVTATITQGGGAPPFFLGSGRSTLSTIPRAS